MAVHVRILRNTDQLASLTEQRLINLDFPNSYYHAIDMLKFSQCLGKK